MSTTTLPNEISPRQLFDLMERPDAPFLLLDVRNEEEFAAWRIEGKHQPETVHIPYFDFLEDEAANVEKLRAHQGKPIVVVCAKGGSSDYVADVLRENGFTASNLEGGMIAWGDLLIPVDVPSREGLVIKQLQRVGKGCVSYFIGNKDGAIVVDPARHIAPYTALADELGMPIQIVFDTHLHADHISGGPELAEATGARYLIDAHDAEGAKMKFEAIEPGHVERIGDTEFELMPIHTPGHTPGSASMLIDQRYLISGDTLFVASIGRPDLGGEIEAWGKLLFNTLNAEVSKIGDDVLILPAHYAGVSEVRDDGLVAGSMGQLRQTNEALKLKTEEDFIRFLKENQGEAPAIYQDIRKVNMHWIAVDEDRARELELGKNQCAASKARLMAN